MKKLFWQIIDWFFPLSCVGCGKEGSPLCQSCLAGIQKRGIQECPYCHKESSFGWRCESCFGLGQLDGLICLWNYQKGGAIAKLLHFYKYKGWQDYGKELKKMFGDLASDWLQTEELTDHIDELTWIPMTVKKYKKRGFNQSEELALEISLQTGLEARELLVKNRETSAQMGLKRKERLNNLEGAFEINSGQMDVVGKTILIIDDIATTLATLDQAAAVLKGAGAKNVFALVAARQKD